jgi:hypothetical protein
MSIEEINAHIATGLAAYATKEYVDTRDALNATNADMVNGDNLRLQLASKNVANGIVGLGADGRFNPGLSSVEHTQKVPNGPWTPVSYGSPVVTTTTETLFTMDVTDPGHDYKIIVGGTIDGCRR